MKQIVANLILVLFIYNVAPREFHYMSYMNVLVFAGSQNRKNFFKGKG